MKVEYEFTVVRDGQVIELLAVAGGYYTLEVDGLPEDSMPAEGEVTELEIFCGDDVWAGKLTEEEDAKLVAALMERIVERQYDGNEYE